MNGIGRRLGAFVVVVAALLVVGLLVWQGLTAQGNPDPTARHLTPVAAIVDTGVLVFREGLECVLVLSAVSASLLRARTDHWKPVATGAGLGLGATLVTWFVVVGIISLVGSTTSELNIQAGTGLLAIVVLLVVMNWFFHRIYWTGWISHQNRKKQDLLASIESSPADAASRSIAYRGLLLLGLASVYREGFEVVLFLQNIRMQVGSLDVGVGAAIGFFFTILVALLTFAAHRRLPYKRMLVFTGVMLGAVLLVMVGEQVQEMQQAGWISETALPVRIPDWMTLWFAVAGNVETITAQVLAALVVLGSYFVSQYVRVWKPRKRSVSRPVTE